MSCPLAGFLPKPGRLCAWPPARSRPSLLTQNVAQEKKTETPFLRGLSVGLELGLLLPSCRPDFLPKEFQNVVWKRFLCHVNSLAPREINGNIKLLIF